MKLIKSNNDEQDIIKACQDGKSWAQRKIYEQHAPAMMSVCLRYCGNRENARDLLQEGFIKVFTKCSTYNGSGSFGGWMRRVFVTTALEQLRQTDVLKNTEDIEEVAYRLEDENYGIVDELSVEELMKCVSLLNDKQRAIFNLIAIEGYNHTETSKMLEIPEATSRSLYMRARKSLQKMIEEMQHEKYSLNEYR